MTPTVQHTMVSRHATGVLASRPGWRLMINGVHVTLIFSGLGLVCVTFTLLQLAFN